METKKERLSIIINEIIENGQVDIKSIAKKLNVSQMTIYRDVDDFISSRLVRKEKGRLRNYFHIGTGNYNSNTSRYYTDIGFLSTDPDISADLIELFNYYLFLFYMGSFCFNFFRGIVNTPYEKFFGTGNCVINLNVYLRTSWPSVSRWS